MKRFRPQAAFLWQALLIAAPLVILSGFALYSLRLDKRAVERDARDRAQTLVTNLADQWRQSAGQSLSSFLSDWYAIRVLPVALAWPEGIHGMALGRPETDTYSSAAAFPPLWQLHGRLLNGAAASPLDYPPLPIPPSRIRSLTTIQAKTLAATERAIFQQRDRAAAEQGLAAMKAGGVQEDTCAGVELNILLMQQTTARDAILARKLIDIVRRYADARTGTGTPVADIALIQAIRNSPEEFLFSTVRPELFHRVVAHPSFMTREIIAAAGEAASGNRNRSWVDALRDLWDAQERVRPLLRQLLQIPPDPDKRVMEVWLAGDTPVFVQRETVYFGRDYSVTLIPARALEVAFDHAFDEIRAGLPSYADVSVLIAGKRWPASPDGMVLQDRNAKDVLASESQGLLARANLPGGVFQEKEMWYLMPPNLHTTFSLRLELARPDLLYASYRRRMWLMAGFILLATAAAGLGLASAWRAFQRQVRLAEMTSNFVSSVSHELRAPLASVRLMAESLDQDRVDESEKQKSYFRLIVQECRRLTSLVENVLDFSRIRQGRKNYEPEPVDAVALVRQTVQLMTPAAEEQQISLRLSESEARDPGPQPCWDGQAVQQALINLIDNAIKHSPPLATVEVGCNAAEKKFCISVADRGSGIPQEEQARIFEPFYRRGSELRRETKGIGIGLSIVKHIADAHGGRVIVDSKPGEGSRFTLELPI